MVILCQAQHMSDTSLKTEAFAGTTIILVTLLTFLILLGASRALLNDIFICLKLNRVKLPGFNGNFLTGMFFPLLVTKGQPGVKRNIRTLEGTLGMCTNVFKDAGVVILNLGVLKPIVFLCKAEAAEILLSNAKEVTKSKEYDYIADWLGVGLITSRPDIWKRHRKLLTPTFHYRILDGFQPIMNEHGNILVKILKEGVGKESIEIEIPVTMCALDIISDTALGIKLGSQQDRNSDYVQSIFKSTALITHRILSPWLWNKYAFWCSPTRRELTSHLIIMNTFIKKLIAQRKAELEKEFLGLTPEELEEALPKRRRAFLDFLLLHNISDPQNQLTEQEIVDEVHTFTFTAHDTVSMAVYWAMYYLGLYPDIQAKVQEELDVVFQGDCKRPITIEEVKQLCYLERVIKESQRLTPAVPLIMRDLQEDLKIDLVTIPKGTTAAVFIMAIHRDPTMYPNPEVFDPDRFLDSKKHPFSFLPFSAGPRSCLGQKYAVLCMKTVIANLLRNLSWKSLDPLDRVLFNAEFAIRPSIPIRLKFEARVYM